MGLLLLLLLISTPRDAAGGRCSLGPTVYRGPDLTLVLGKAAAAPVTTRRGPAQKLRFERLEGAERSTIRAILASATDSTIWVLPWGHDAACRQTPWPAGQAWAPRDSIGLYKLLLLPKQLWHQGKPTFDAVVGELQPFPQRDRGFDRSPGGGAISASEYFDFLMALPTYPPNQLSASPPSLERWIRDHPDLLGRYPVAETLLSWGRPR